MNLFKRTILSLLIGGVFYNSQAFEKMDLQDCNFDLADTSSESSVMDDIPKFAREIMLMPSLISYEDWSFRLKFLQNRTKEEKYYFESNYDIADLYGYNNYDKLLSELEELRGIITDVKDINIRYQWNALKYSNHNRKTDCETICLLCDIWTLKKWLIYCDRLLATI